MKIPVVKLLNILERDYNVLQSIESDEDFDEKTMAYLSTNNNDFIMHIRETVYDKACEGNKTCIGFICHEMCHYFLISWFGYGPLFSRNFFQKHIENYKSMEWQAKALCGEVMIPYEHFKNSDIKSIMRKTDSSYTQTIYFIEVVCKETM